MDCASYVFPAVRGTQAQREYYVSMVPLDVMSKIFQFADEELPPEIRAQRILNKSRIPEIRDYILSNPDSYVFSALTVSVDGNMEFTPADETRPQVGAISISMTSRFLINDGQHRRAAIAEAIKMNPSLKNEHISVVFYRDEGLLRSQQMFSDLNRYAIKPTKSINILFNSREESSIIAKRVIDEVDVFKGLVEKERTAISNRSKALFTLSAICTATSELLNGSNLSTQNKIDLAKEYWSAVGRNISEWNMVKSGEMKSSAVRKDYICSLSITLVALGHAGNALIQNFPETWKNHLEKLSIIDWRKTNPAWDNLVFVNGRVAANAIKLEMQKISSEVERVNEEILQMAVDASTPLFMCRNLVTQSYDSELSSQQSEAKLYSDKIIVNLHQQILERLVNCGLSQADLRAVQDIINDVLVGHIPESATKETIKNMSATSMMLYQRLIAEVFQSITQRIDSLVNHVDAQESELMSLDAHLGAADEKTLAMQLFDALKSVEGEKALADAEYQRQLDSIESLKRQREMLVAKRIQLIKAIAEKEQANDDNARIVKYAAMSIEVLREFKVRLQREKVAKLSSTATKCFRELVEKDSLVSEIKIDPTTLDVTILDLDGNELLKSQLSAGEQQMFAVAIVWALALTSGYKAPVIIDTPMARLDSSHRANFVTKYLPAASSQVMVLSTDEEVYGRYLDLVRDNVVDYYTLLYREEEQCTSIVHGYFGEV